MEKPAYYRVINRKKFAVIMVILLSVIAVGVWVSLDRVAEYGKELQELAVTEPVKAAATIKKLTRTLAVLNGIVLSSLAILIIWDGRRSWRSEAIPPKGSWILEGQRTWTGESAVRIAKFKIAAGVLLGVLGIASSLILWRIGDTSDFGHANLGPQRPFFEQIKQPGYSTGGSQKGPESSRGDRVIL